MHECWCSADEFVVLLVMYVFLGSALEDIGITDLAVAVAGIAYGH